MGLENRDYLRDEERRYSGGGGGGGGFAVAPLQPMVKKLLIATIAVFVVQILSARPWTSDELLQIRSDAIAKCQIKIATGDTTGDPKLQLLSLQSNRMTERLAMDLGYQKPSVVQEWLQLQTSKVLQGQVWRLFTCAFCHDRASLFHIFFNMMFLFIMGPQLENMYSSREFLWFYLASALSASLSYMLIDFMTGDPHPMIGASGAVMGIVVLLAMNFPRQILNLFFVFPVELRWIVIFYAVIDLFPLLKAISGSGVGDNVAHAAHLGGMVFGYVYYKRGIRLTTGTAGLSTWWRAKRHGLKVVSDAPANTRADRKIKKLSDNMDDILKKISEQGEASLTSAERKTLEKASRELRDRRR